MRLCHDFLLNYIGRPVDSPRKKLSLKLCKPYLNQKKIYVLYRTRFDFCESDHGFALCFFRN
ncbi:hypothetical protein DQM68_13805 [Leptospira mayottensis]|uniref:Uncharacterized protein n=1 Tax=Leptospira mayottensis TaxID=1137606 RepID=A0ABN5NXI9_9LEPT|nr:hypothetical protein DQM68_13805 [Leptospira mayottensis]AXR65137.1 hypothetical protein DQM28_13885 [Leptospira mayottensis]AXR69167.1 hypothetical protein DPV73_15225 [Leptospira mayottensis]AZQ01962.1 hypothetical protein LEP1GSC190_07905 [Leptospira mayottensis 200901116]TGN03608.1 hypothetical protein EHR03_11570 [Leptospira mayottensis]